MELEEAEEEAVLRQVFQHQEATVEHLEQLLTPTIISLLQINGLLNIEQNKRAVCLELSPSAHNSMVGG